MAPPSPIAAQSAKVSCQQVFHASWAANEPDWGAWELVPPTPVT